jgi:hypothetical protein
MRLKVDHIAAGALLALPIVLCLLNRWWTFLPPRGYLDPYVYTGYFLDLKGNIDLGYYQGSRLPWLLVGNAAYSLLPAEWANLALRFGLFYGGTFSLFVTVRGLWRNTGAAFIAAVLLGTHTYFLWGIHWDYIDGPVVVFTLAAVAMTVCARRSRWWPLWCLLAGFLLVCAVGSNLINAAPYPPALVLSTVFFANPDLRDRRRIATSVVCLAGGSLAALVVFGAVYYHLTGEVNWLARQVAYAREVDGGTHGIDNLTWFRKAGWLAFPLVAAGVSVYGLLRVGVGWWIGSNVGQSKPDFRTEGSPSASARRINRIEVGNTSSSAHRARDYFGGEGVFRHVVRTRLRFPRFAKQVVVDLTHADILLFAAAALMCLGVTAFYALYEAFHGPVLEVWYYTNFLMPFAFTVIGGAVALALRRLSPRQMALVCVAVVLAVLAPIAFSALELRNACGYDTVLGGDYCAMTRTAGLLTLLTLLLLLAALVRRYPALALAAVLLLGVLNTSFYAGYGGGAYKDGQDLSYEKFLLSYDLNATTQPYGQRITFWYRHQTPELGFVFHAVAGFHHMYVSVLSYDFPRVVNPDGTSNTIPFDRPIAILTPPGVDALGEATEALAKEGLRPRLVEAKTVSRGELRANVTVIRVEASGREVLPFDLGTVQLYEPNKERFSGQILTPAQPYGAGGFIPIPRTPYTNAYVVVKLNVQDGPIEVCLASADAGLCLAHQTVEAGAASVVLKPHDFSQAYFLLIRSGPKGVAGRLTLESAALYVPD